MGDVVTAQIQQMMLQQPFYFKQCFLPLESDSPAHCKQYASVREAAEKQQQAQPYALLKLKPFNNIFMSPQDLETTGTLLVVIQGSGAVRPGQWARALCINESLEKGTIFPYIQMAYQRSYQVLVLNPNMVCRPES